jgi:hypothetical protein
MPEETNSTPVPGPSKSAGFVAPIVGREVLRSVPAQLGFSLIKEGEKITALHIERARQMGRLYELIAATKEQ